MGWGEPALIRQRSHLGDPSIIHGASARRGDPRRPRFGCPRGRQSPTIRQWACRHREGNVHRVVLGRGRPMGGHNRAAGTSVELSWSGCRLEVAGEGVGAGRGHGRAAAIKSAPFFSFWFRGIGHFPVWARISAALVRRW